MYKQSAPIEIDAVDTMVPIHLPNNIPDKSKMGVPKPNSTTQTIENKKKIVRLYIKLEPTNSSIFDWIVL